MSQLALLCQQVKSVGAQLEQVCKGPLDSLQTILTKLCQDKRVDIFLRLQLLKLIELRSLGWRSNQTVESYYKERFSMLRDDQTPRNNVKVEEDISNIGRQATLSPSVASHCKQGVEMS